MGGVVFLDRDGVINENRPDYVKSWSEFEFLPGSLKALAALHRAGYRIVVVTNQSGVGRGLISRETLHDIHARLLATVRQYGGDIEHVLYCPHRPEDDCHCRKPQPGMLLAAANALKIDLRQSFMVGDAFTDIQAGQAAGCRCFLVLTGRGLSQLSTSLNQAANGFQVVPDLNAAVEHILDDSWRISAMPRPPASFAPHNPPVSSPAGP